MTETEARDLMAWFTKLWPWLNWEPTEAASFVLRVRDVAKVDAMKLAREYSDQHGKESPSPNALASHIVNGTRPKARQYYDHPSRGLWKAVALKLGMPGAGLQETIVAYYKGFLGYWGSDACWIGIVSDLKLYAHLNTDQAVYIANRAMGEHPDAAMGMIEGIATVDDLMADGRKAAVEKIRSRLGKIAKGAADDDRTGLQE